MNKPRLISQFVDEQPIPDPVNPRECDHMFMPADNGLVVCPICGWFWLPEDEIMRGHE